MFKFLVAITIFVFCGLSGSYANEPPRLPKTLETIEKKIESKVKEYEHNKISAHQLIASIEEEDIDYLNKPSVSPMSALKSISKGTVVCRGTAVGKVYFNKDSAQRAIETGKKVILLKDKLADEDLTILSKLEGVIALHEDPSTHASIVIKVSDKAFLTHADLGLTHLAEGSDITLDAFNGKVYEGLAPLQYPKETSYYDKLQEIIDNHCPVKIHANIDTAEEAKLALKYGARGIFTRTEHMFFDEDKLPLFRQAIFIDDKTIREDCLNKIMRLQTSDFASLFSAMKGYPIIIRLLDPPLHEFVPKDLKSKEDLARRVGIPLDKLENSINRLNEVNPMMGQRGIRLLITRPDILMMQVSALFKALRLVTEKGIPVDLRINIPMVVEKEEVRYAKNIIHKAAALEFGKNIPPYKVGIMVETPRAALLAEEFASEIDFISFGTNDLTAQTFAFSRGDVYEKFLNEYFRLNILKDDPFIKLDRSIKWLISHTITAMKKVNPSLYVGFCGEQGSDYESAAFLCDERLNSISVNSGSIPKIKLFLAKYKMGIYHFSSTQH